MFTRRRYNMVRRLLDTVGIEPARVRCEWISSAEGTKFARVVSEFVEEIRALGPNPVVKTA